MPTSPAVAAITRPLRQFRPPGGGPPPLPGVYLPGELGDWHLVASSWINALRFVSTDPIGKSSPKDLRGFVDMRVHVTKYPVYRYEIGRAHV